ncbi:unnamed protein product [Owenia fusiformis]|uniref:Uncharacterized protein n=1 Tax=Owenia fusiformis TaxID=6347 RepID=A0A8S4NHI8_OWEFU|nr:unnamed protein product [Owenia fusiformis]
MLSDPNEPPGGETGTPETLTIVTKDANYIPIDQVDLTGKLGLVFQVQACESAYVALSAIFGDTNSRMYEILISGSSNTKSVIRDCTERCDRANSLTEGLLKCNESVSLWIGWTNGHVALGKGHNLGINPLVEWDDSSPEYITSFAVSTANGVNGTWKFTPDGNCSLPLTRGILSDGQVTYSSSSSGLPRFNQNSGWYHYGSKAPWLQVDLLQPHKITKMALQGYAPRHSYWVKTFQILYSVDGTNWLYYNNREIVQRNRNGYDVEIVELTENMEARYFRILPITWNIHPGIRMELYGCQKAVSEKEYTSIKGDILDDEVLFLFLSPYIVSKKVAIRPEGTLTIQPGVKIIFTTAEAGFEVHGNLLAQGIGNLPIEFTADDAVSEISSYWSGLNFVSGDSLLQHAYVEGARVGIQATGYSVTLDHVTITKCSAGIKYIDGGSPFNNSTMISDSNIGKNGGHGIEFKGSSTNPVLSITRTVITGSQSSGIYCSDTHANISIEDSELSNNAQRGDVKHRVCGNNRDMYLAHVTVSPFYTDSNLTELNEDTGVDSYFTDSTGAIGGVVSNNETIPHVFNHTYHVRRNILILPNATLTVKSGVKLAFDRGIGIYIIGELLIKDTDSGGTLMRRKKPMEKWEGIRIASPSPVGLFLNNVQLDGSTYGIHGQGRNITLNGVTISNTYYAIYVSDTITGYLNITITNSTIDTSSNTGISIQTSSNSIMRAFNIKMKDVDIRNTRGNGAVYIYGGDSKADIGFEKVSIQDSTHHGVYIYYRGQTDIQLHGCEISEYSSYAIYARIRHGMFELGNCIVKRNINRYGYGIYYHTPWTYGGSKTISIYNNTFMDQNSYHSYGMVNINPKTSRTGFEDTSFIAIVNNTFRSTNSRGTSAMDLSNINYFSSIVIEGNIIHGMSRIACAIGSKAGIGTVDIIGNVISESNGALSLTSDVTNGTRIMNNQFLYNFGSDNVIINPSTRNNCSISYNIFLNNSNNALTLQRVQSGTLLNYNLFDNIEGEPNYNVKVISSKGGADINAKFNWWGSKEQSQIVATIYDNMRDPSVGVLDIFPYLLSHNYSDVSIEEDFFRQDGSIGGEITGNVTLRCDDSPYDVVSEIVVMEGASLLIEQCVVLKFAENIGIRVKGEIHMNGTAEKRIHCVPRTSAVRWAGISITTEAAANGKGDLRLVGDTTSGRLEVFYNGQWGSVCDDNFDTSDAKVACRHLGMGSEGATYRTIGGGTGPIWLDDMTCNGGEASLFECKHRGWGSHDCGHGEDVGITCVGLLSTASRNQVSTLKHVHLVNTTIGLHITGIVPSVFQDVESSGSSQNGMTFDEPYVIGNVSNILFENVITSENNDNGLYWNEESYRMSNIEFVNMKSTRNKKFGLYYAGSYQNISVINSLLTDNIYGAVHSSLSTSSLNIESTEISRNTHGALYSKPASDSEFNCTIRDCNIAYNGIPSDTSNSTFYFSPNGQKYNGVFFLNNRFIQNTGGRMIHYRSQHVVIFSNNTLLENTGVALYTEYNGNNARLLFHDNHIEGNNANPAASGNNAYMFYGTLYDQGSFDFERNVVVNNTAPSLLRIASYWYNVARSIKIRLEYNVFENNHVATSIDLSQKIYRVEGHNNIFNNPIAIYEIRSSARKLLTGYHFERNYWGLRNLSEIEKSLNSHHDNINLNRVFIHPFATNRELTEFSEDNDVEFLKTALFGGDVVQDVVVEYRTEPYYVQRSIYIREGASLTLRAGVHLKFPEAYGIIVEGRLVIEGSAERKVVLSRKDASTQWEGIIFQRTTAESCKNGTRFTMIKNFALDGNNRETNSYWDRWYCIHRCRIATYDCKSIEYRESDGLCQLNDKSRAEINSSLWNNYTEAYDFYEQEYCNESASSVVRHVNITGSKYGMLIYDLPIQANNVHIEEAETGLYFAEDSFGNSMTFRDSRISQTSGNGILIKSHALRYLDMTGSVVDRAGQRGIHMEKNGQRLIVNNGTISRSSIHGIQAAYATFVLLDGVTFDSNYNNGAYFQYPLNISFTSCVFKKTDRENRYAVYVKSMGYNYGSSQSQITMTIKNSVFEQNSRHAIKVTTTSHNHNLNLFINIHNNLFRNNSDTLMDLDLYKGTDVLIEDNTIEYNIGSSNLIDLHPIYYRYVNRRVKGEVHIVGNEFLRNQGMTMVYLHPDNIANYGGTLTDNVFTDNVASQGIIRTTSGNYSMHYNILENPSSVYELYAAYDGDDVINATFNWWGSAVEAYADERIFDKGDAFNAAEVVYIPMLSGKVFTCFAVNNCSNHGECVRPDRCRCDDGWQGPECNQVSCEQVRQNPEEVSSSHNTIILYRIRGFPQPSHMVIQALYGSIT